MPLSGNTGAATGGTPAVAGAPDGGAGRDDSGAGAPLGGNTSAATGGTPSVAGAPGGGAGRGDSGAGASATAGAPGSSGYCVYDFVAHGPNETFLARDGCNTCVCQDNAAVCTEVACTPDCDHHPPGRLCLIGEWDGGPTEYFKVGAPLLAQIEPVECISAWCNDKRIATCSIVSDPGTTDITVIGDFCTQFVDRMLCDDCGAFSATCDAPALVAGTYSIRLADTPLSIELTVPSAVPPSSYCVELPR